MQIADCKTADLQIELLVVNPQPTPRFTTTSINQSSYQVRSTLNYDTYFFVAVTFNGVSQCQVFDSGHTRVTIISFCSVNAQVRVWGMIPADNLCSTAHE